MARTFPGVSAGGLPTSRRGQRSSCVKVAMPKLSIKLSRPLAVKLSVSLAARPALDEQLAQRVDNPPAASENSSASSSLPSIEGEFDDPP
jgi:hypothetical protein